MISLTFEDIGRLFLGLISDFLPFHLSRAPPPSITESQGIMYIFFLKPSLCYLEWKGHLWYLPASLKPLPSGYTQTNLDVYVTVDVGMGWCLCLSFPGISFECNYKLVIIKYYIFIFILAQ